MLLRYLPAVLLARLYPAMHRSASANRQTKHTFRQKNGKSGNATSGTQNRFIPGTACTDEHADHHKTQNRGKNGNATRLLMSPPRHRQRFRQRFRQDLRTPTATPSPAPSPRNCVPGTGLRVGPLADN